jgi:hypothetical protein
MRGGTNVPELRPRPKVVELFRPKHQQSPLANRNRPFCPTNWLVGYGTGLHLIIRNITPFGSVVYPIGQWTTSLGNRLVNVQGLENCPPPPRRQGYRGLPGDPRGCCPWPNWLPTRQPGRGSKITITFAAYLLCYKTNRIPMSA